MHTYISIHRRVYCKPFYKMSNLMPIWDLIGVSGDEEIGQSSTRHEHVSANSWLQIPDSLNPPMFQEDIYEVLSDVQLPKQLLLERETLWETKEGAESRGVKRKTEEMECRKCPSEGVERLSPESGRKQDVPTKRTRSAELHTISDRRRRDRIKEKMEELRTLIPNCNKSDKVSILDDAIEYLIALKNQTEMMSMLGGTLCQAPIVSPPDMQTVQYPIQFPGMGPDFEMGMRFGMGRLSMCYSAGLPMTSFPSVNLHTLPSSATGLHMMSGPGNFLINPHAQMPLVPSDVLPDLAAPSNVTSNAGFSPAFQEFKWRRT